MPEIPLIGKGSTTSDDPEFGTLTEEEREQLAAMAEEHPDDVSDAQDVTTAFIIVVNKDGSVAAVSDVTTKFAPDRMATGDDVIAACAVAVSDLQAQKAAQLTALQMAQMGRMMQEQQQSELVRQRMMANQGKGFGNLG